MTLDLPGSATLVATTAISVRGLDHSGTYEAFEHVGERTADRLVAKLDHLASNSTGREGSLSPTPTDPERREVYSSAQAAKRAGRYVEARAGFESVAASSRRGTSASSRARLNVLPAPSTSSAWQWKNRC